MRHELRRVGLLGALALAALTPAAAATLQKMNLQEMSDRADKVFRGEVVQLIPGSLTAGGGEIPTVTYVVRVDETFKGTFDLVKGQEVASITMLGKLAPPDGDDERYLSPFPDMPRLTVGESYLLLTTPPGSGGLSTTVGLGQGCFHLLQGTGRDRMAVNEFNNLQLFTGMPAEATLPRLGPIPFPVLAEQIQAGLGE